jgi:hypothetical protein
MWHSRNLNPHDDTRSAFVCFSCDQIILIFTFIKSTIKSVITKIEAFK